MEYPFNADKMISAAEKSIGRPLTDYQKKFLHDNIDILNFAIEFDDEHAASKIPLLEFNPANIKCKYPNLYAEYKASGYHIGGISESAGVTKELMTAVFEEAETLTLDEILNLYNYFMGLTYPKARYGYIDSPELGLLVPGTNKTRYRMKLLKEAVCTLDKLTNSGKTLRHHERQQLDQAREVINQICNQHKAVPFAFYRWALDRTQNQIDLLTPEKPRRGLNSDKCRMGIDEFAKVGASA